MYLPNWIDLEVEVAGDDLVDDGLEGALQVLLAHQLDVGLHGLGGDRVPPEGEVDDMIIFFTSRLQGDHGGGEAWLGQLKFAMFPLSTSLFCHFPICPSGQHDADAGTTQNNRQPNQSTQPQWSPCILFLIEYGKVSPDSALTNSTSLTFSWSCATAATGK